MAFRYSPKIVTDGLVFYLDAANTKSYVSGSTTWNDISREGNNGTLINGPTFSSQNGGSIVFDGTDDTVSIPSNSLLNTPNGFTGEIVVKFDNSTPGNLLHKELVYTIRRSGPTSLQWADGTNWSYANWNATSPSFTFDTSNSNKYYHIVVTKSVNVVSCYLNGELMVQKTFGNNGVGSGNSLSVFIGSYAGSSQFLDGNVAMSRIYNRALSQEEVLQNYNATKSRFGLT
jgi:hypothetical protein